MSNILEKINQLPKEAQDYLCSEKLSKNNIGVIEKYNFSDEQVKEFLDILDKLFLKEISVTTLPAVIFQKLKIKDDKTVKSLIKDILEDILSPIAEYLGIKKPVEKEGLAGKAIKKFNLFNVPVIAGTPSVIASDSEAIPSHSGSPRPSGARDDRDLRKRFTEMAESFLFNARTKLQFKNTLMKAVDAGGLGMEKDLAEQVAEYLASYSRLQPVIARAKLEAIPSDAGSPCPEASGLPTSLSELRGTGAMIRGDVDFSPEEKEAEKMKRKIEDIRIGAPKLMSVTEGVKKALEEINLTFPSEELNQRLKTAIDARIRNVRTSVQTFEKLTTGINSGGLGLPKIEADKVSLILNKYLAGKSKDIYESKVAEIKQFEEKEKEQRAERGRQEEDRQQKTLNEKFKKLTGKETERQETRGKRQVKSIPLPAEEAPYFQIKKPSVIARRPRADEAISSQSGSPRPEASGLPTSLSELRGTGAMTGKVKPVVEDIAFTPKLYGPVEEIGNMTLEDFRKLSDDPKETILKIKDKLSLLRQESFKKYHAGLDAWKKSPVYGDYLKAIGQSLSGAAPLEEILNSGKSLTKEEFDAIIISGIGD